MYEPMNHPGGINYIAPPPDYAKYVSGRILIVPFCLKLQRMSLYNLTLAAPCFEAKKKIFNPIGTPVRLQATIFFLWS